MAMPIRSYSRSARCLALPLAVSAALTAGCALKSPPTAADLKADALPGVQLPTAWTAAAISGAAPADNWVAAFADPQLAAGGGRGD